METVAAAINHLSDYETERGKPMPSLNHSIIQFNLSGELFRFKKKYRFVSELSLELASWKSTPDLAIFPPKAVNFRRDEIRVTDAPLGVIEILSPTQSMEELLEKADDYFAHGVLSCWLVMPSMRSIHVFSDVENYQSFRHTETLVDDKLGISIELENVFA